jgi:hypothetical protein
VFAGKNADAVCRAYALAIRYSHDACLEYLDDFVPVDISQHPGAYGQGACDYFGDERSDDQHIQQQDHRERGDIKGDDHIDDHHGQLEHNLLLQFELRFSGAAILTLPSSDS